MGITSPGLAAAGLRWADVLSSLFEKERCGTVFQFGFDLEHLETLSNEADSVVCIDSFTDSAPELDDRKNITYISSNPLTFLPKVHSGCSAWVSQDMRWLSDEDIVSLIKNLELTFQGAPILILTDYDCTAAADTMWFPSYVRSLNRLRTLFGSGTMIPEIVFQDTRAAKILFNLQKQEVSLSIHGSESSSRCSQRCAAVPKEEQVQEIPLLATPEDSSDAAETLAVAIHFGIEIVKELIEEDADLPLRKTFSFLDLGGGAYGTGAALTAEVAYCLVAEVNKELLSQLRDSFHSLSMSHVFLINGSFDLWLSQARAELPNAFWNTRRIAGLLMNSLQRIPARQRREFLQHVVDFVGEGGVLILTTFKQTASSLVPLRLSFLPDSSRLEWFREDDLLDLIGSLSHVLDVEVKVTRVMVGVVCHIGGNNQQNQPKPHVVPAASTGVYSPSFGVGNSEATSAQEEKTEEVAEEEEEEDPYAFYSSMHDPRSVHYRQTCISSSPIP